MQALIGQSPKLSHPPRRYAPPLQRLTQAEVFSALHEGASDDSSSRSLSDISLNIDAIYRFGEIDDNTIISAILARRGADVTRDIRTEFLAALIYRNNDIDSLREFSRRLVFNYLIGNGDAHLKNWSLLYGRFYIEIHEDLCFLQRTILYQPLFIARRRVLKI